MGSIRVSLERTGGIAGYLDCFPKITGSYAQKKEKKGKVNWSDENNTLVNTLAISHVFFPGPGDVPFFLWMACRTCLTIPPVN